MPAGGAGGGERADTTTWDVVTHGGRTPTGFDAVEWAQEVVALGAGEILLTSMDRDGTQAGYDLELLRAVGSAVPVPVIASGGVGTLEHMYEAVSEGGADAVLAASIFHFGTFRVRESEGHYPRHSGAPSCGPDSAVRRGHGLSGWSCRSDAHCGVVR